MVVRAAGPEAERAALVAERLLGGALGDGRDIVRAPSPAAERTNDEGWLSRAVLEAEDHFARFALSDAQAVLDDARARLASVGVDGASTEALVELFLMRARVAQAAQDPARASLETRQALAILPRLAVDEERHPPSLTALVESERGSVSNCALTLELAPEAARVSIDGGALAGTPSSLPCGVHWVLISARAHTSLELELDVSPEAAPRRIELELDVGAALESGSEPFTSIAPLLLAGAEALHRELLILDVAADERGLVVALGATIVHASRTATPDEIIALLLASRAVDRGPDLGLVVGVSVGAAAALAIAITIAVVFSSPSPATTFELRGHILP